MYLHTFYLSFTLYYRGWFFQNVLLTQSRDHVVRLWLESLNTRRQQFHMCNVIPAGTDSVVGWLASLTGHEVPTSDPFAPIQNEENVLDDRCVPLRTG